MIYNVNSYENKWELMMSIIRVAEMANVSKSTVSRVLTGNPNVSPKAVAAVKAAMLQLNYHAPSRKRGPRASSRNGKSSEQKNILYFVGNEYVNRDFRDHLHLSTTSRIIFGIERVVYNYNMNLILAGKLKMDHFPELIKRSRPIGAFILGDSINYPSPVKQWMEANPVVQLLRYTSPESRSRDLVSYNNLKVGEIAADYLLSKGHKQVAFFNFSPDHEQAIERKTVFTAKITAGGGQVIDLSSDIEPEQNDLAKLHETKKLIAKIPGLAVKPTAIFSAADAMTCFAYPALRDIGIEPMRDIDIISCDNTEYYMGQMAPRPATIDIGCELIGERALETLCWRLANPGQRSHITQCVEPVLVEA